VKNLRLAPNGVDLYAYFHHVFWFGDLNYRINLSRYPRHVFIISLRSSLLNLVTKPFARQRRETFAIFANTIRCTFISLDYVISHLRDSSLKKERRNVRSMGFLKGHQAPHPKVRIPLFSFPSFSSQTIVSASFSPSQLV
jgi:hypothetical protein